MIAINDAFHLDSAIYTLLRKYLREKEYYVDILDLFHEVSSQEYAKKIECYFNPCNSTN